MQLRIHFLIILCILIAQPVLCQSNNDPTSQVKAIGFTTTRKLSQQGEPLLVSLWYPTDRRGSGMSLEDYIIAGKLNDSIADAKPLGRFIGILKRPLSGRQLDISNATLKNVLSFSFNAIKDAPIRKGKFPVIISTATPDSYIDLFEYFASRGFIVAAMTFQWKDEPNDSLLYVQATDVLEELLDYVTKQVYTDTATIIAFGHGGGIQPAFYLAMRSSKIKALVNLDGGVFGARSKTTLSPDYKPSRLKAPMLHIVTQSQYKEDEQKELNALANPRYRVVIKSDSVLHHDFTTWGRVIASPLHLRGPHADLVNAVFASIEDLIVDFARNRRVHIPGKRPDLFQYELIKNKKQKP